MKEIEDRFNAYFSKWDIRLSPEDVANRSQGKINKAGWAIWYQFGADEKGEYLDYYAAHRMTDDSHVRIYYNGEEEYLPAIESFRICSQDPEEDKRLEAEYLAENRRVAQLLNEKGFGIEGDEPSGVQVNRVLRQSRPE